MSSKLGCAAVWDSIFKKKIGWRIWEKAEKKEENV